jgi:hypothetical protein
VVVRGVPMVKNDGRITIGDDFQLDSGRCARTW